MFSLSPVDTLDDSDTTQCDCLEKVGHAITGPVLPKFLSPGPFPSAAAAAASSGVGGLCPRLTHTILHG